MPAVISTRPSRQPSNSSNNAIQSLGLLARSAQRQRARAGITHTSGWKSNRLLLNTTGCSHQRPHANQQSRCLRPACAASIQIGTAVKLRASACVANSH